MTYALTALMAVIALSLACARRRHWAEAATILIVALPITLCVPQYGRSWYRSLRAHHRLTSSAALALAPHVIPAKQKLPLAQRALSSIAENGTYAVVPHLKAPPRTAVAQRERSSLKYLESWLQYWLAPRIQVDPAEAQWLIVLNATGEPLPRGARTVYRIGDDVLVER